MVWQTQKCISKKDMISALNFLHLWKTDTKQVITFQRDEDYVDKITSCGMVYFRFDLLKHKSEP